MCAPQSDQWTGQSGFEDIQSGDARWQNLRRCARARRKILMIRKLKSGKYRLYSRKKNPKTEKRRNPGTFKTKAAAKKHERAVQYFKRR